MRLILIVPVLLVVACGVLFGALNGTRIAIDFYFFELQAPCGIALLCALLAGWLCGGLVAWLGQIARSQRRSRAARGNPRLPHMRSSSTPREEA